MDHKDFFDSLELEKHKTRCKCYLESNNAAIKFSSSAMRSGLLLNGMGAVAVLYSPQVKLIALHATLYAFAIGALLSVMAFGVAYLCQSKITETWLQFILSVHLLDDATKRSLSDIQTNALKWSKIYKVISITLIILSYFSFGIGSSMGYYKLSSVNIETQLKQETTNCNKIIYTK